MKDRIRVCLYDADATSDGGLARDFERLPRVVLTAVFGDWGQLQTALLSGAADCAAINLDGPQEGLAIDLVRRVREAAPSVQILGISASNDAEAIIGAMRAGCAQFVRRPIDLHDLDDALRRIGTPARAATGESRRICVIASAGGAGATTISCNLALALAHVTDRRCGLVDLHLEFGDVAYAFDAQPRYSIADAARDGVELDESLMSTILEELPNGVSLLGRPARFEEVREVTPEGVARALAVMAGMFPYVVVDVPRTGHDHAGAAVSGAYRVLIVAQLSVPFLRNATRVYEGLSAAGVPQERIEIVLNRCHANFERITPEDVEQHFRKPVFAMIPNDYRRVVESHDLGNPILTEAPRSPARRAIQEMASRLAANADGKRAAATGLLGRLLGRPRQAAVAS